jgi:SAM-dependent methyltransferase
VTSSPWSYDDATFDVVHAHQVLQHLGDPVAALVELRRVLRPGGVLAVRDSDYGAFVGSGRSGARPLAGAVLAVTARNGHDARIGPSLLGLAHAAGFDDVTVSSSRAGPSPTRVTAAWWGGLWADRVRYSRFAEQAVEYELSSRADPEELLGLGGIA